MSLKDSISFLKKTSLIFFASAIFNMLAFITLNGNKDFVIEFEFGNEVFSSFTVYVYAIFELFTAVSINFCAIFFILYVVCNIINYFLTNRRKKNSRII